MRTTITRIEQAADRVRRIWRELDHAQRRLFELRTGI